MIRRSLRPSAKPLARRSPLRASGETKRKKDAKYKAYLRSPAWHALRDKAIRRAALACEMCHYQPLDSPSGLHVHHKTYTRFGRERITDLIVLCVHC
jgi:5-methylcytosine-specific restriction endonuclease McrA